MKRTDSIEAFTVALLRYQNQYLMLQRSPEKQFAPGRWTGLGGRVEQNEYSHLLAAALREVEEESGIRSQDISDFVLRRTVLVNRPYQSLSLLLYYTGELDRMVTPACPEGMLYWKKETEFASLDIIETTRPVLSLLTRDMERDPQGMDLPNVGVAVFTQNTEFQVIHWAT